MQNENFYFQILFILLDGCINYVRSITCFCLVCNIFALRDWIDFSFEEKINFPPNLLISEQKNAFIAQQEGNFCLATFSSSHFYFPSPYLIDSWMKIMGLIIYASNIDLVVIMYSIVINTENALKTVKLCIICKVQLNFENLWDYYLVLWNKRFSIFFADAQLYYSSLLRCVAYWLKNGQNRAKIYS